MHGKNHAILGAAGGILAGVYLDAPVTTLFAMGMVGTFGGLLPDADTKSSLLGRLLPNWWHKLTPGHRGITHSLLYCGGVLGLALLLQWWGWQAEWWEMPEHPYMPVALTVGALTHLFADGLTVQGVPLFYPIFKRRIKLLGPFSFRTGSGVEPTVVTVLISIAIAYLLMPYIQGITDIIATPTIMGMDVENVLLFLVTVAANALVLTVYSRSKSAKSRRHSRSRKATVKRR